jgi:hypothetical protein
MSRRFEHWRAFFDHFGEHLHRHGLAESVPTLRRRSHEHVLLWRLGDHLDHVRLLSWLRPDRERPRGSWITRVSVNHLTFEPTPTVLRRLWFGPRARSARTPGLHVEWTALDGELVQLARWLPVFLSGQLDPSAPIPLPPVASHVFGTSLRETVYAWTAAAWTAENRYRGHRLDWLPGYAIPADKVVAEPGAPAVAAAAGGKVS